MQTPFTGGSGKKKKTRENQFPEIKSSGFLNGELILTKDTYENSIKEITSIRNRNGVWKVFLPEGYLILKEGVYRFKKVGKWYIDQEGKEYELNV